MARPPRPPVIEEDEEDGIDTVLESQWDRRAPIVDQATEERWVAPPESDGEARTEHRDRMPLAFIGETVMDDSTVEDPATAAKQWRNEGYFNVTPTLPRADTPRSAPAPIPRVRPAGPTPTPKAPTPPSTLRTRMPANVAPPTPGGPVPGPPPPPPGLRTVTPPTGQAHTHGLPEMAMLDGSISPSPPYRDYTAPPWAPPPPPAPEASSPSPIPDFALLVRRHRPTLLTTVAIGTLVMLAWFVFGWLW